MVLEVTVRRFALAGGTAKRRSRGLQRPVVLEWIPCRSAEALKSGLAVAGDPLPSLPNTSAVETPGRMPQAYTVAMVVLCMQPSNQGMNRTAQELRSWVPVAHCAPAAGYAERSTSCAGATRAHVRW